MFRRILVGIDDSRQSREALAQAIELVDAAHGRLGLLSAAPAPPPVVPVAGIAPVHPEQLQRDLLAWAQRNVDEAEQLVPERVPVTKLVTRGSPVKALLEAARSGEWDLIVVGQSQRRRRLPFRGAIGDRLNRRSPTPVLVVHEPRIEPRRDRTRVRGARAAATT